MALLSFRQYAKLRGVSVEAVSKAVKNGRISTVPGKNGKPKIDPAIADLEWAQNSDPAKKREPSPADSPAPVDPPKTKTVSIDGEELLTYNDAKTLGENYKARLSKIEYREKSGKLVSATAVQERWQACATIIRTKVLGIPAKSRQRIPDLTPEQYEVLEAITREALEELTDASP